jgi:hypothetical protein
MEYSMGSHHALEIGKMSVRLRPPLIGALVRLSAFALASIRRADRPASDGFIKFLRAKQVARQFRFGGSGLGGQETRPQFR